MIKINTKANEIFSLSHEEIVKQQNLLRTANWARSRYIDILTSTLQKINIVLNQAEDCNLKDDIEMFFKECEEEIENCNQQIK
jgi:hypothetical protein